MLKPDIKDLLARYKSGDCTEEERYLVDNWYLNWVVESFDLSEEELGEDIALIKRRLPREKRKRSFYFRFAAAAIVLITLSTALYFFSYLDSNGSYPNETMTAVGVKIVPGKSKATLTLADGSTIVLDGKANLDSISQFGVKILNSLEGKLTYIKGKHDKVADAYNTITTPNGGQYDIILPDGTKVWLNAASKLRFPIVFNGDERIVDLDGEAYFEVSRDKTKPFKVKSGEQEIKVLGTHFNVNAYSDEPFIKTTLLEGKVLVTNGIREVTLSPGEQAISDVRSAVFTLRKGVDVQESIAWKNGLFMFEKESIFSIMNKVSRWYDVDVEYRGDFKGKKYSGNISKFEDVTEVFKTMQLTGTIQFKIEGRRVVVMP